MVVRRRASGAGGQPTAAEEMTADEPEMAPDEGASSSTTSDGDQSVATVEVTLAVVELEKPPALDARKPLRCHLHAKQVPEWLRFPYIETGYREGGSYWSCAMSMLTVAHNEALNAWTMAFGALVAVVSLIYVLLAYPIHGADASPFVLYVIAVLIHLPFSFGYHTFVPMSPAVANLWRRLDMSFVLIMSVPLTYGMSYFAFPRLWQTYLATGAIALITAGGIRAICVSVQDGQPLERSHITRWVGATAVGYYLPIVYEAVATRGRYPVPLVASFVVPVSLVGGAILYEYHVPERFFPGQLDLAGNSHMWMHFGVTTAHSMGFCFVLHGWLKHNR